MADFRSKVKIIQSHVRARNARERRKLLQWARYNWAASVIQRAYRRWQMVKQMLLRNFRKIRDRRVSLPAGKTPTNPLSNAREAFQRVVIAKADFEVKVRPVNIEFRMTKFVVN